MKPIGLNDLEIYNLAMDIGDSVWKVVMKWNWFEKKTIGDQLVRSSDSIAANISEGFGRYHFGEKRQFSYYSRGSLFETKTWIEKAQERALITEEESHQLQAKLKHSGQN